MTSQSQNHFEGYGMPAPESVDCQRDEDQSLGFVSSHVGTQILGMGNLRSEGPVLHAALDSGHLAGIGGHDVEAGVSASQLDVSRPVMMSSEPARSPS